VIDIWCKVQKSWQYLQPIFYSEDIIRQMPKEGNKYQSIDKIWRGIMLQTFQSPTVLDCCLQARMMENFQICQQTLEQVTKGLNDYLNFKRSNFPRFYFLSNEELLSILAQTREPQAVQRHLPKCFEGIDRQNKLYNNLNESKK
jgi:dynein heavy chain, axonemal